MTYPDARQPQSQSAVRRAFTLIELLIVIAIIAILAAILFPAFSRARENARRSACQSNLKQLGLCITMYNQDFDERMMPAAIPDSTYLASSSARWPQILSPYMKLRSFVICPSADYSPSTFGIPYSDAVNNPAGTVSGTSYDYIYGLYPSYGYNYAYLAPHFSCPDGYDSPGSWTSGAVTGTCEPTPGSGTSPTASTSGTNQQFAAGTDSRGINVAQIESPATTIAMADSATVSGGKVVLGYFSIRPPQTWAPTPGNPPVSDTYGRIFGRHLETTNVLFADGHVKAMKLNALRDKNLWRAKKLP